MAKLEPKTCLVADTKKHRVRIERMLEQDVCVDVFTKANRVITFLRERHDGSMENFDSDFRDYSVGAYRHCHESGLSLVARDEASGSMAAFLFLEKLNVFKTHKPTMPAAVWLYDAGDALYHNAVDSHPRFYYPLIRNMVMHINTGGTTAAYEGTGVGSVLRSFCEQHALAHGFESVTVEPAHPATRHIYENKLGYTTLASMNLESYVAKGPNGHAGKQPWAGIGEDGTFALCEKVTQQPRWYQRVLPGIMKPAVKLAMSLS